jgi:DNA polymerase gamma 1
VHPIQQRFNALNIQMLSDTLHKQVFPNQAETHRQETDETQTSDSDSLPDSAAAPVADKNFEIIMRHLKRFGLLKGNTQTIADVDLDLPKLYGQTLDEHFRHIATEQIQDYKSLADAIAKSMPSPLPKQWVRKKGWTKYNKDGSTESVPYPDADAVIFDIECLMREGHFPTMATALSTSNWCVHCVFA